MALVKTVNGLALASVKTVDGLAAASLQTVMGLDAVVSAGYDFEENFETATTGYENTGWTTYNSASPAYTTGPLEGAQSLYAATGALRGAYRSRSATGEVWVYWQMKLFSGVVNDWQFYGDLAETSVRVGFSGGKFQLFAGGGATVDAGSAPPLDTKLHVWVNYKPGSGTGYCHLYWSTDGVRGSAKISRTSLTATTEMSRPWWVSRNTYAVMWDRIIINATAIGDNP